MADGHSDYLCAAQTNQTLLPTVKTTIISFKSFLYFIALTGILMIQSCVDDVSYEEVKELEGSVWPQDDTLVYSFSIDDTAHYYSVYLTMRIDNDYPYSNIYAGVNMRGPGGQDISELKGFEMADKEGKWKGKSYGGLIGFEFPLYEQMQFHEGGTYKIHVLQYMRTENLAGVHDAGIKILKGAPLL